MENIKAAIFELERRISCSIHGKNVASMFVIYESGPAKYICSSCYTKMEKELGALSDMKQADRDFRDSEAHGRE